MRLAIVIHEFPPFGGGASTASSHTARELAALGHDVCVVTAGGGGMPSREQRDGFRIERLPAIRNVVFAPGAVELLSFCASAELGLTRRLRAFGAEAVVAYFAVPAGLFAVRAARRLGLPVVVSLRGSDVPGFRHGRLSGRFGKLAAPAIRRTLARATIVAPNSDVLERMILEFMPELSSKIEMLRNGIEASAVASRPAASDSKTVRLVQVGQLIERKRVGTTIDALAELRRRKLDVELTVVGDGPLGDPLRDRVRDLGLADRVSFAGHLPREQILELLRAHDVFVMTSVAEGMSNALLEGVAAGLPVVTTANGSHDVVVAAGAGVVVPIDDVDALVHELESLTTDTALRRRFAESGLTYARQRTWANCARELVAMIEARAEG